MELTIALTEEEMKMIRIALDERGDKMENLRGQEEAKKYWELSSRFIVDGKEQ